jgi:putative transposase
MGTISLDLRRRTVEAYRTGRTKGYEATAAMFGVGRASLDRWLRRFRETGDVLPKPRGGNNPRKVDDEWLRVHAEANPDARIPDRIAAWAEHSGKTVSHGAMWNAMQRIGWTHKKRRWSPANATTPQSKRGARGTSKRKLNSTRSG